MYAESTGSPHNITTHIPMARKGPNGMYRPFFTSLMRIPMIAPVNTATKSARKHQNPSTPPIAANIFTSPKPIAGFRKTFDPSAPIPQSTSQPDAAPRTPWTNASQPGESRSPRSFDPKSDQPAMTGV